MSQPTVAQYLVSRLAELGVMEFFGVPEWPATRPKVN